MGADMRSGPTASLWTRKGCGYVSDWCWPHMPDMSHVPWDEIMGVYDFPDEVVQKAHAAAPTVAPETLTEEHDLSLWYESRKFLEEAAKCGEGIYGGY